MQALRNLPKIDKFITHEAFEGLSSTLLTRIAKEQISKLREDIQSSRQDSVSQEKLIMDVLEIYHDTLSSSLRPLINATGVILHTNMGRSLIDQQMLEDVSKVISGYSNLEYDQDKGCRGERYEHASKHLCQLLDVEDVLVVNNNASAVFLILNTFAKGKEAVVSRGELVEIGGSFRIPEVMAQSGALLHEVGATNKTKLHDYQNAINEQTAMLMKVHQSNFSIEGFSEETSYTEIRTLAQENGLIDYYDVGSGYVVDLPYGLGNKEPSLQQILKSKPSLISFSGDKLFGSVQAGIIAGKKDLIAKLKKNQLLRMLRVDKITLGILEQTTRAYLEHRYDKIPTIEMIFTNIKKLEDRAEAMRQAIGASMCQVVHSTTVMGGGTLPNREFPTIALQINGKANTLEKEFRDRGVIGRIEHDSFLIDFRALQSKHDIEVIKIAQEISEGMRR